MRHISHDNFLNALLPNAQSVALSIYDCNPELRKKLEDNYKERAKIINLPFEWKRSWGESYTVFNPSTCRETTITPPRARYWGEGERESVVKTAQGVDAIVYLCRSICNGLEAAFPGASYDHPHITELAGIAEEVSKPLFVGYQDDSCRGRCSEWELPNKSKCQINLFCVK